MSCRGAGRAGVNWTCTSEFKKETENMFSPVKKNPVGLFKEKKKRIYCSIYLQNFPSCY